MFTNVSANSTDAQFHLVRSDDSAQFSVSAWLRLDWRVVLTLVLLAAWGGASRAQAQASAQFSYAQSTIASGLSVAQGVAVDGSGNVYVAENGGPDEVLKETLQSDGTYKQTTIGTGWGRPVAVAVDANGNVYVADQDLGEVVKETPSGTSYTASVVASTLNIQGVAVDANGNVYFTVSGGSGKVVKATPNTSGGGYTTSTIYSSPSTNPYGVTVDGSGNVYVANSVNVLKLTPGSSGYSETTLFSVLGNAEGVAVDGSGNLYIAESNNNDVLKETLSGGTYTQSTLVSGLNSPGGVAVDAYGDVYIANALAGQVLKVATAGVNFHTVAVGSKSAAQTLLFTITRSGTLQKPQVTAQGATNLDFADAGTGSCTATTYSAGNTCTVDVTFTPTKPGTRYGAVNLVNASGYVIATAYLYGTGQGPQVAFGTAAQSTTGSGLQFPIALTVDASGNVYVADPYLGIVVKETLGAGGAYTQTQFPSTGLSGTYGLAVDGSGNVYASAYGGVVKETLEPNGTYAESTIVNSGLNEPHGVAVDGSGNVYISDTFNNRVLKETLQPDGSYVQSVIGSGFQNPYALAVDASGNLYIADNGSSRVLKETLQPDGSYVQSVIGGGLSSPEGVAVDGTGNVYIADSGNNRVLKETLGSGGTYTQSVIFGGGLLNNPTSVAVDGTGNVYIVDNGNSRVLKEDFADAPSLTFATAPTATATQTVTLENIGNAPLTLPALSSAQNPTFTGSSSFTLDSSVGCPVVAASGSAGTLAANSSCTLPVDFTPQATGSFSGTLAITDNDLNASSPNYAAQTISLTGTATMATTTTTLSAPSTAYYGAPVTLTATVASTTAGTFSGTVTFSDGGTTLGTASANGSGVATFTTSLLSMGAHTLAASYGGNAEYTGSTSAAVSLTIQPASFTLTITGGPVSINPGQNASFPVTVAPEGTFSSPISFQCSMSSPDIGCTVTPGNVTLGTSPATVTLAVQTSGNVAALPFGPGNPWSRWGWPLAALGLLSILGLGLLTKSHAIPQRVRRLAWAGVLATGLALGLAACGSSVNATPATPAGSYTASITGTSGSQRVTKQVSVTVK